jgi:hypothetical protein
VPEASCSISNVFGLCRGQPSVLRHPNIVLYMGAFDGTPPKLRKQLGNKELPLIVFEWLDGGNLFQAIHGKCCRFLSFDNCVLICGENCSAVCIELPASLARCFHTLVAH